MALSRDFESEVQAKRFLSAVFKTLSVGQFLKFGKRLVGDRETYYVVYPLPKILGGRIDE